MFQNYKLLGHLVIWNIFFALICIPTAGKMIDVGGILLSVSIFYFPFVYIISDILTEVYGYALARRVLWYTVATQIAAVILFQLVLLAPVIPGFEGAESHFEAVLGAAPQLVTFGLLAVFLGDITNNYILAKMKVWSEGKHMPARLVASTLGGEFVNTAVFYTFGLWGILPVEALIPSIIAGAVAKTVVEIVMLPLTIRIVQKTKRIEGIDHFDTDTNFNPLKI